MKKSTLDSFKGLAKAYNDALQQLEESQKAVTIAEHHLEMAKEEIVSELDKQQPKFSKEEIEELILSICDMDEDYSAIEGEWNNHCNPKLYYGCESIEEYIKKMELFDFLKAANIVTNVIDISPKVLKSIVEKRMKESGAEINLCGLVSPNEAFLLEIMKKMEL